jgi:hypothetical protein
MVGISLTTINIMLIIVVTIEAGAKRDESVVRRIGPAVACVEQHEERTLIRVLNLALVGILDNHI